MVYKTTFLAIGAALLPLGAGATAQSSLVGAQTVSASADDFSRFAPQANPISTRLDFSIWDEALRWFVLRMGRSLREAAPQPEPPMGSRMVFGHDSRYRLEGNRVAFSFMNEDVIASLTAYRRDLEELPNTVDLTALGRNEQLAYWINLHNVAVIEQIALAYPVSRPSLIRVGGDSRPLDEAPFITVAGVKMSPQDIRTKIVYPHWQDPKVMYGFFRGEIGGPSIQREAYSAENLNILLEEAAREFVNSLRGTQRSANKLLVSQIYREAQPFYFADWPSDLKAHLRAYGTEEVQAIIGTTNEVDATLYEADIADLNKGEREPNYSNVTTNGEYASVRLDGAIARLMAERKQKMEKILRRDDPEGRVTVLPDMRAVSAPPAEEIE